MTRITANGVAKSPSAKLCHAMGHTYLDILQNQPASEETEFSSRASTSSSRENGLDVLVLGLTTSTAMDEIDFALCRYTQANPEAPLYLDLIKYDSVLMPSKIRSQILAMLQADQAPPSMVSQMDVEIGHVFSNATHTFCKRHDIVLDEIDLIGSGGQLVSLTSRPPSGHHRANMCLGEGAVICANTGITTVSDFRTCEQAIGRQGAPLFAYMLGLLLHHPTRLQICITIGGITTVNFIPPDSEGGIDAMYDWDSGPGTVLLDAAFRFLSIDPTSYTSNPLLKDGKVCQEIVDELLNHTPYLQVQPPKTTAREIFGDFLAHRIINNCKAKGLSVADIIATLTELTIATMTSQLRQFGPGYEAINNADIVIDGRGMYNPSFLPALKAAYPGATFGSFDKTGVPSNAKKAVGFAMQAMEAVLGRARPVTKNADTRRPNTITGKIAPGTRWRDVMAKTVNFGHEPESRSCGWEGLPEVRELRVVGR